MTPKQIVIIVLFALVGWAICGASIGIGMALMDETGALVLHAVVAPVAFGALAWLYAARFAHAGPLATAAAFLGVVVAMDVFVVAMLIQRSFAMFKSPLGTWLPFALIFLSAWIVGRAVAGRRANRPA